MRLRIASRTHRGARAVNEDACGHTGWPSGLENHRIAFALADGAGGQGGGETASTLALATLLDGFRRHPECSGQRLKALFDEANAAVVAAQRSGGPLANMRTTAVVLLCDPEAGVAIWGHCGDSRLVRLRDDSIAWQTRDHSLYQVLADAGLAGSDAGNADERRNVLFAALGEREHFEAEILPEPVPIMAGDVFLLCSDGFWGPLPETRWLATLAEVETPDEWLDRLAGEILALARPQQDNLTALAVWID